MAITPLMGRRPCLIFDFIWSGLNAATTHTAPEEVMLFGGTLHRITKRVLLADPNIGPVYLGKVDMDYTYMRL